MPGSSPRVLATPPPVDVVMTRLAGLRRRIEEGGRDPAGVRIVAVTKGFTASAVDAARRAGLYDIGENYADELLAKAAVDGVGDGVGDGVVDGVGDGGGDGGSDGAPATR